MLANGNLGCPLSSNSFQTQGHNDAWDYSRKLLEADIRPRLIGDQKCFGKQFVYAWGQVLPAAYW